MDSEERALQVAIERWEAKTGWKADYAVVQGFQIAMDAQYVEMNEEIDRLRSFAAAQTCKCKYYGDGDWVTCHRCYVLGIKRV